MTVRALLLSLLALLCGAAALTLVALVITATV
jgi:hypothetical protein